MKKIVLLSTLLVFGLAAGFNRPTFSTFDLNGDKKITPAEYKKVKDARMAQRAKSGRMMRNANRATFSMIDTNNDGIITPAEFAKHQQSMFNSKKGRGRR